MKKILLIILPLLLIIGCEKGPKKIIVETWEDGTKYIGEYEDIIQTTISLQNNNCNFIDGDNTTRKKELERIWAI